MSFQRYSIFVVRKNNPRLVLIFFCNIFCHRLWARHFCHQAATPASHFMRKSAVGVWVWNGRGDASGPESGELKWWQLWFCEGPAADYGQHLGLGYCLYRLLRPVKNYAPTRRWFTNLWKKFWKTRTHCGCGAYLVSHCLHRQLWCGLLLLLLLLHFRGICEINVLKNKYLV